MDLYYYINFLTVQDYACICDSQRVHGYTCVVSIVLLRHVEKYQHGLFTFVFDFDSIESIEKAAKNKVILWSVNEVLNRNFHFFQVSQYTVYNELSHGCYQFLNMTFGC